VRVLVGVTGGIAAYKTCEVVRRLREGEHEVQVVMTESARRFVTPTTFQVLSGRVVATSLFDDDDPDIDHIRLARWPDVVAVVPATAQTIGRFAHGLADDLLSTIVLAVRRDVPVVVAPAMNTAMWENELVQANLARLLETGRFRVVSPVAKTLACGEVGLGGLAEEARILDAVVEAGGGASS